MEIYVFYFKALKRIAKLDALSYDFEVFMLLKNISRIKLAL